MLLSCYVQKSLKDRQVCNNLHGPTIIILWNCEIIWDTYLKLFSIFFQIIFATTVFILQFLRSFPLSNRDFSVKTSTYIFEPFFFYSSLKIFSNFFLRHSKIIWDFQYLQVEFFSVLRSQGYIGNYLLLSVFFWNFELIIVCCDGRVRSDCSLGLGEGRAELATRQKWREE